MTESTATERRRERDRLKKAKRRAKRKAEKLKALAVGTSTTSPVYRRKLPQIPEMSKAALRAMLAQAVRNTAGMQA